MKVAIFLLCLSFCGCSFYSVSFKPEVLEEKKILSSRKSELISNNKVNMVVVVSYLNNVNPEIYNAREYFFIEVFSELDISFIDYSEFKIIDNAKFLWIREIPPSEFDDVLKVTNKWSRGFLIAFEEIDEQNKKNMELNIDVYNLGNMNFNFKYEVFEMKI